ncbi:MAG: hypothetical protein F6K21_12015 [Symploca sp. SIO2D2]|nr:hypothetical protein [Symploca sp. SIO2D2]NER20530.1 hypothetical protein [Symploca sp. SIO1C2]
MSDIKQLPLSIQPVISYPREAQVGKTYLMTVDLQPSGNEWPYEEEEYPIYCMLETSPLFSSKPVGEPAVVLHRFGGTYGAAKFLLTAAQEEMEGEIRVTLVNAWGVPVKVLNLPLKLLNPSDVKVRQEVDKSRKSTLDLIKKSTIPKYKEPEDVLKAMQPMLDQCAARNNYIDGIAILIGFDTIARSRVDGYGGKFDTTMLAALLDNFTDTSKNPFGKDTSLEHLSFMDIKEDGQGQKITAWSLVCPYKNYRLVFVGNLQKKSRYPIHRATVEFYLEKLLPLIMEYDIVV